MEMLSNVFLYSACMSHQQSLINIANFGGDVLMNRRAWRCKDRKTTISEMGSKPKTNGGSLNYHQGRRSQRDVEVCLGAPTRSGVRWSTHSRDIMEGGAFILISLITSYKEVPTPI